MKVKVIGIPVQDQEKALQFYTTKLGFIKKHDTPLGEGNRWLTVVSKDEPDGVEVLLEPAKTYQKALFDTGIPYTQFNVDDLQEEYDRLVHLGVAFTMKPTEMANVKIAILDDTCGNKIQLIKIL